jgi:predicted 3-demethylubiquinone-9 3-methyltransferase (glyoxalase superfamily)
MISPIFPCLWFDNQAGEAARLYCSILPDSHITAENPIVVTFELNGTRVIGLNGGPLFSMNPSISLIVNCELRKEADRIWNILIEGGSAMIPIDAYPWSKRYGWLQDRYGMTWQITWYGDERSVFSVRPCMLFVGEKFGKAEEASRFYTSVFENSSVETVVVYPEGDANAGKIMYSEFILNNSRIAAMDGPGEHGFTFSEGISFVAECETQEEIDFLWEKLTDGGEESMCGWLRDRFGVSWQIIPSSLSGIMTDPLKASLAFNVFRNMKKLDIAEILKAVEGR